jgi:hypothetical protein
VRDTPQTRRSARGKPPRALCRDWSRLPRHLCERDAGDGEILWPRTPGGV